MGFSRGTPPPLDLCAGGVKCRISWLGKAKTYHEEANEEQEHKSNAQFAKAHAAEAAALVLLRLGGDGLGAGGL